MVRDSQIKINYQIEMEEEISRLGGEKPHLLLHSCCGPCSTSVLERLLPYFRIEVFYYNPNIHPAEEYRRREEEQKRYLLKLGIPFRESVYEQDEYFSRVEGLEGEPEGGSRCGVCFRLRLEKTALAALEEGFPYFGTTLSVSSHKNSTLVNQTGIAVEEALGGRVRYLRADFKKKEGYKRSLELSGEEGMYRQDYCGCLFSMKEREKQREKQIRKNTI